MYRNPNRGLSSQDPAYDDRYDDDFDDAAWNAECDRADAEWEEK